MSLLQSNPRQPASRTQEIDCEPLLNSPDGVVRLPAGNYRLQRPLTLFRGLRVQGAGANLTIIRSASREFLLRLQGEELFEFSDVCFVHEGEQPSRVLWADSAHILLERCVLRGGCWVDERDWGCGLHLSGTSRGRVAFCEFTDNDHGILLEGQTQVSLESNRLFENRFHGMRLRGLAGGRLTQNECSRNGMAGILIQEQAAPAIESNRASQNGANGIQYEDHSGGICLANDCDYNHQHGLALSGDCRPEVRQNQCNENHLCGIDVSARCHVALSGNVCQANQWHGIQLQDEVRPLLEGNRCSHNLASGIAYFGRAGGTARSNESSANDNYGIQVSEQAEPFVDNNRCSANRISGIAYFGSSGGLCQSNQSRENHFHGLQVSEEAAPTVQNCHFLANQLSGLACFGRSQPALRRNHCLQNEQSGVYVGDEAQPFVDQNLCQENSKIGIQYTGGAGGILTSNHCLSNAQYGIHLGPSAVPLLHNNTCTGNPISDVVCLSDNVSTVTSGRAREERQKVSQGFQLTLELGEGETTTLALGFEPKPNERKVLETVARYGKSSEAQLSKVTGTRRIAGLIESLIEKLQRGNLEVLYREGDGPEGAIYAFRRNHQGGEP